MGHFPAAAVGRLLRAARPLGDEAAADERGQVVAAGTGEAGIGIGFEAARTFDGHIGD
jgi:hypothetical protein